MLLAQIETPVPVEAPTPVEVPSSANLLSDTFSAVGANLQGSLVNFVFAIITLVVGWLVASFLAATTEGLLKRTNLDNRLSMWLTGQQNGQSPPIEKWTAAAVFWVIMLLVLVAFLQILQLTAVITPLSRLLEQSFGFLPKIFAAAILVGIAWVLASLSKLLLTRSLQSMHLDERLNQQVSTGDQPATDTFKLTDTLANTLYWFIFLLFLPSILKTLELQGSLEPIQRLLEQILSILPNIFAAGLIGAAGWLIAQVVRRIVTNLLAATGTDQVGMRLGLSRERGGQPLSWIIGTITYVLILIPAGIAALEALRINAISDPAIAMLRQVLNVLPQIFTAVAILVIAYVLGQFIKDLVTSIFTGLGFNNVLSWLGFPQTQTQPLPPGLTPEPPVTATKTPSEVVGIISLVGIIFFAVVAAVDVLKIQSLTVLVAGILVISGQVLAGVVIFGVGLYLATLTFNLITSSGSHRARILAHIARVSVLVLTGAMALQQIGIAPNIVNLAFGLLLGSIAVAAAIAFGLGGRDIAAEQIREWLQSFRSPEGE